MKTINKKHILAGLLAGAAMAPIITECVCLPQEGIAQCLQLAPHVLKVITFERQRRSSSPLETLATTILLGPWTIKQIQSIWSGWQIRSLTKIMGCDNCTIKSCPAKRLLNDFGRCLEGDNKKCKKVYTGIISGGYLASNAKIKPAIKTNVKQ